MLPKPPKNVQADPASSLGFDHTWWKRRWADPALLEATLAGYRNQLARVQQAITGIRHALALPADPRSPAARRTRRDLTAASRKHVSAARKKRWAGYKKAAGKS